MESNNLINKIEDVPRDKKLIVFDLDGTLTESKFDVDSEMSALIGELLKIKKVAVIGGGKYELFKKQFLSKLDVSEDLLKNLSVFPATATVYYKHVNNDWHQHKESDWEQVYSQELTAEEKHKILEAFEKTFAELGYQHPDKIYGELVEDRGTQITFSALGQEAPLDLKIKWRDENHDLKLKMVRTLQKYLPEVEVAAAGYTSIDITRKGIDKEFGLEQMQEYLNIPLAEMLFVGDALFEGGNDYAALRTGIPCFEVRTVEDTKMLIKYITQ